jgi:hypothetical protein
MLAQTSGVNAEIFERAKLLNDLTVTLYDWMAEDVRDGRNLVATDRQGVEVWRAKPVIYGDPRHQDCFTAIRWDGVNLTAYTWTGYKVSVDADSGDVTTLEFTK